MAIKAIIFDCFGVLVIPGRDLLRQDYPEKTVEIADLVMRADYGYISKSEYDQQAIEITGLSADEFQARYWNVKSRNVSAFEWMARLRAEKQYKIGLLSNIGVWRINDFISPSEREQLFDAVVLSGEVGIAKPSVEIFELMAERIGVTPPECVMIDDLVDNIEGAEMAGMKTILFQTTTQAQTDLAELLKIAHA
jgi:putative hydrolase of the HAD superfamily